MLLKLLLSYSIFLLRVLTTPSCWFRNYPTNKIWDGLIRQNLEKPVFTEIDQHTVKLNGKEIWIANYPYAFANTKNSFTGKGVTLVDGMPTRRTVFELRDALTKYVVKRTLKQIKSFKKEHQNVKF